jgi:hypothetical protein
LVRGFYINHSRTKIYLIQVGFKVYITDTNVVSFYEEKIGFKIEKGFYSTIIRGSYLVPPQEIPPFVIKAKYS